MGSCPKKHFYTISNVQSVWNSSAVAHCASALVWLAKISSFVEELGTMRMALP